MPLELNRACSVRLHSNRRRLRIAQLPPKAIRIDRRASAIADLLHGACQPTSRDRLVRQLRSSGLRLANEIVADLERARVLVSASDPASRYDRHELYFSFFGLDPSLYAARLAKASVGILGVGGIGSNAASLLAAAGIGRLVLCDADQVELSNLTRTTLFTMTDLGIEKVHAAKRRITERNPEVTVETLPARLERETLDRYARALSGCELLVLSSDVGPVHAMTQELARRIRARSINAGYVETFGVVGPMLDPSDPSWVEREPCDAATELNSRLQAPSYGPLNQIVSAAAANEAIRSVLGLSISTLRRRMLIDSMTYETRWESRRG